MFVIRRFACSCNGTRPAAGRRSERPEPASTLLFTCLCAASATLFNTGRACSHPSWLLLSSAQIRHRQTDILFSYLLYDNDAMLINARWILTTAPFEPHHRVCVCGWKWKFRFKRWGGRPVGYDQP
ncbi:Xylose isomerase [Trichinella spiralis]|uniref:Xylose isomerase n=1 Tax=Trichinella spiralis TaxID=6334 RepID=A0ABR3KJ90_TRISP